MTIKLLTSETVTITGSATHPSAVGGKVKFTSATWTPSDLTLVDVVEAVIAPDGLSCSCRLISKKPGKCSLTLAGVGVNVAAIPWVGDVEITGDGALAVQVTESYRSGVAPVVDSLTPNTAVVGGADFTLHVIGRHFKPGAVIVFNGGVERTTFVSDTELTTLVKPSLFSGAITLPVAVRGPSGAESAPVSFTVTAV